MNNPYRKHLIEREGKEVILHRAASTDLKGTVHEATALGCVIKRQPEAGAHPESSNFIFVAYGDIRGVEINEWDHNKI